MKKLVFLFLSLFVVLVATENVNAQNEATATAQTSATIIEVIKISKELDLKFGNIVANLGGGTVEIEPDGNIISTGVEAPTGNAGDRQPAQFEVSGMDGAVYTLSLPSSIVISDGTNTMTVNGFSSDATGTLDETINVGAILNVGASQASGNYTGSFDVKVAYN